MTKAILILLITVQAELLSTYTFTNANGNEATSQQRHTIPHETENRFNAQKSQRHITDYYSFTIQPNCGLEMTLTSLTLDEKRSSKGIRNWTIRSSLDDFATDLKTFNLPDNTKLRNDQTITLDYKEKHYRVPKSAGLYNAAPYRAYDHDPLIIGLNLANKLSLQIRPARYPKPSRSL
ncbi:MAG: hypothetical protein ABFS56_26965 [Pseudomonadota bacterium]